jgi:NADH:ubiquinone oxidoreductase subunit 4 (subunit M)
MTATDTLWMTALIFTPTVFALLILFVPKGKDEAMRWLALFGAAITLAVSIIVFMGYL